MSPDAAFGFNSSANMSPPLVVVSDPAVTPLRWFLVEMVGTDDSDDNLKRWSSFIGICIAISGNVLISLALNIQKLSHTRLEREEEHRRENRLKQRRLAAEEHRVLDGEETLVEDEEEEEEDEEEDDEEPLLSRSVSTSKILKRPRQQRANNTLDGPPETPARHSEKDDELGMSNVSYISSPYWWLGLVLMFFGECGNFLAYGFAPASIVSPLGVVALISNCVFAPVLLKEPFRSRDALGVLVSVAGAVVVVWSAEKEEIRLGPDEILGAISQTAFEVYFGITSAMILTLMYISTRYGHKTIMIDLGLVALLGGYTVLSTKGISSLISSSFYHIFQYPIAYLFTFVLATTAILQIKYINRALKRFDSTQVIPTQFVLFTISVIVGSAVLYRDFEAVGKDRMLKFVTGCALTFAGVYLISSKRNNTNKPVPDEEQALSETTDLLPPTPTPEAEASTTISVRPPLNRRISAISASPTPSPTGRKSDSLHRALNLMPGSGLISGYQLQSVIVERVSESLTRAMSSEFVGEEEEEEGEEPHLHHQLHRRRSSLGVVLDYMKGKRREEGEGEGVGRG